MSTLFNFAHLALEDVTAAIVESQLYNDDTLPPAKLLDDRITLQTALVLTMYEEIVLLRESVVILLCVILGLFVIISIRVARDFAKLLYKGAKPMVERLKTKIGSGTETEEGGAGTKGGVRI